MERMIIPGIPGNMTRYSQDGGNLPLRTIARTELKFVSSLSLLFIVFLPVKLLSLSIFFHQPKPNSSE